MGKGRKPCCDKAGVKKGAWSEDEDMKLISFIQTHGHSNWRALPKLAGLARCGKSCRLRWVNYLRPDIKRGNFTALEEDAIIKLHQTLGNRWSKIASHFPGRTDNEIKNVWNTHLKKRIKTTQEPLDHVLDAKDNNAACSQQIVLINPTSSIDTTPNEQQLNSPLSSCCSQASFSNLNVNEFDKEAPDRVEDTGDIIDEVGIYMNEMEIDLVDEILNTPFEPNLEWWDLLDSDDCNKSTTQSEEVKLNVNNPSSANEKSKSGEESDGSWWWLVYLENELGLVSQC